MVLLGITGHPNAKIGGCSIDQFIVHVPSLVHSIHLLQQFQRVLVPIRLRHKGGFVFEVIAPQNQDIIDPQKMQINQGVFGLFLAESPANKMRDRIHFEAIHDGRTNRHRARTFAGSNATEGPVRQRLE